MATLKSPGFGPSPWNTPSGNTTGALLMDFQWGSANPSSYQITSPSGASQVLNWSVAPVANRTKGWDLTIELVDNTETTGVYLNSNVQSITGTVADNTTSTDNAFTLTFAPSAFLVPPGTPVPLPTQAELANKKGPYLAGTADTTRFYTLTRDTSALPATYRNVCVESSVDQAFQAPIPKNPTVTELKNQFAINFKVTTTNGPNSKVYYRTLVITFSPLIDIGAV